MIQSSSGVKDRYDPTVPPSSVTENAACSQIHDYIQRNPTSAVLIGLGVGFGTGVVLASLLQGSTRYFSQEESLAHRIGNQVKDSLDEMLPASLMKRFRS